MKLTALILSATAAFAQPSFREEKFQGRHAFVLSNGVIRVAALRGGGHIAEIRFEQGSALRTMNPMRIPHYPTIDPHDYDPAKHDPIYGTGSHRWLSAGYMGHLLCFPVFGPPSSDDEVRAGLGNHGEAPIAVWNYVSHSVSPGKVTLDYTAGLPKSQFRAGRTLTLHANSNALHVREWVENLQPFDRPINWVQHATFGPPFAEPGKMFIDMPATKGEVSPRATGASVPPGPVQWNDRLRPFQPADRSGTYIGWLFDPSQRESWFTMYNAGFPVLIGYVFPTSDNPWLGDWQENRSNTTLPWNGQVIARGIEFGTSPFAEGLRKTVERGKMFGVPTFRWIGALARLETEFTIFLDEIPAGYRGTARVERRAPHSLAAVPR